MHPGEKAQDSLGVVRGDNSEPMLLLSMSECGDPVPCQRRQGDCSAWDTSDPDPLVAS